MNPVKIEATLDASNPNHVKALSTFLTVIGSNQDLVTTTKEIKEVVVKKPTIVKEVVKPIVAAAELEPETEEVEIPEVEEEALEVEISESEKTIPVVETTITVEELRKLVAEKQAKHRDAVKAKLIEFDAQNTSSLLKEHYEAFKTFLTELKD